MNEERGLMGKPLRARIGCVLAGILVSAVGLTLAVLLVWALVKAGV